jgi:hypothetical protein
MPTIRSRYTRARSGGPRWGIFRAKSSETAVFETCNMFYFTWIYTVLPPSRTWAAGDDRRLKIAVNSGDWNMLGMVARWGHNTLLIGLALMTCVIFVGLFK